MQVHLLDGTYELFRAHFGAPPRSAPDGQEVGATIGLLRSFAAMLREPEVTHVAAAFDHVIESFRNDMFDGYKTGEGMDPVLYAQFPLAEEAARALGIVTWPMERFEADDALATAARKYRDAPGVDRILLCSPDKDLTQMVRGDHVVCFDRRKREVLTEQGVVDKFGVRPESIPDYLGLVGDTADGIPGIPRWGKKGAATVLARYGHIEDIPRDAATWDIKVRGAASLSERLEAQRDDALLFRELAVLRTDVPIRETAADLRWAGPDQAKLDALCERLGVRAPSL